MGGKQPSLWPARQSSLPNWIFRRRSGSVARPASISGAPRQAEMPTGNRDYVGNFLNDAGPVPALRLMKQFHRRVPWGLPIAQGPPPVAVRVQQGADWRSQSAG